MTYGFELRADSSQLHYPSRNPLKSLRKERFQGRPGAGLHQNISTWAGAFSAGFSEISMQRLIMGREYPPDGIDGDF